MFNHGRSPPAFLLTAAFVTCAVALQSAAAVEPRSVEVEGTQFKVTLTDGHVLRSSELVGATLTVATSSGPLRLRIDTVERDPDAKNPPVWLHSFSTEAPALPKQLQTTRNFSSTCLDARMFSLNFSVTSFAAKNVSIAN